MRSWLKALLISVVILTAVTLYLPSIIKQGLNTFLPWAMETADLKNPQFYINKMSWHQLSIEEIHFEIEEQHSDLVLNNLLISFSPWQLIRGKVQTLTLESGLLNISPTVASKSSKPALPNSSENTSPTKKTNPSDQRPEDAINLLSLEEFFAALPIESIKIEEFIIIHPEGEIRSGFNLSQQQAVLKSTIKTPNLTDEIQHQLVINNQGSITSTITSLDSEHNPSAPIFNLQAQWLASTTESSIMKLSLQQSADIQSWFNLLPQQEQATQINSKVAIQAWNLDFSLPKLLPPQKILTSLTAQGLWQVKVSDLYIRDNNKKLLENTNIAVDIETSIDPTLDKQWHLNINSFDINSDINTVENLKLSLTQRLKKALHIACGIKQDITTCDWQGEIDQILEGDNIKNTTHFLVEGNYKDHVTLGSDFFSQQTFSINTLQENDLWPKIKNSSHGDLVIQATKNKELQIDDLWYWQLNFPYGINNTSQLLELPSAKKPEPRSSQLSSQLSEIQWQLLPDWQLTGINAELTSAKVFSLIIKQLNWKKQKQSLLLDYANISCNLDWLKLQYSPQLRSQQSLAQLPLFCDWDIKNKASQWDKWPVPALNIKGHLDLSSLDLAQSTLNTKMTLSGLAKSLDLTLLAQHDFKGLQQGSAQLYLNNLELNWQKMGLERMAALSEAQLLGGSLSAQGWIQWQQYQPDIFDDSKINWRWKPDLMLRVDDLSGIYQESTAWEDIDLQLAIRRPFYKEFRIDSQVSALSINPGINIENVLARSTTTIQEDFKQALVVIEEVHSDVLGGRINVPLVRYDTSQSTNAFGIEIEGIQIEQIAALEANSGITATGQLDGVLPIVLLPEGPQVPAGSLFARAPGGVIKFTGQAADSLKQSDPTVGLAMQVLSDFRYDTLQTNVTYQPNGELKLGLQFQGKNPTFFDGQATHLNLNLDYNLLDLLESLRISNDVVQKLENKYQ